MDEEAGTFALAAMSVALVNYTSLEQKARIKEVLSMTAIGAMFEKEKEDAVADAIVLTQAKDLVESVDQIVINATVSLEEACRYRGINIIAYNIAKKYIEEHTEKKEPVAV